MGDIFDSVNDDGPGECRSVQLSIDLRTDVFTTVTGLDDDENTINRVFDSKRVDVGKCFVKKFT